MVLATRLRSNKKIIIIVVLAVGLIAGLAYALLQSRNAITGNTISTASANLLVSADGVHYSQSIPGFDFDNIVPGGYPAPSDGYPIYLKNTGDTTLDLKISIDDVPSNPDNADLTKINVGLTDTSGQTSPHGFDLQQLVDGGSSIEGELAAGASREYKLQALAASDASPGTTISGIDLAFTGTARDPNDPNQ